MENKQATTIQEQIEQYNQRVFEGRMTAHQKNVLRQMIKREDAYWEREAVRVDSHNAHDDQ